MDDFLSVNFLIETAFNNQRFIRKANNTILYCDVFAVKAKCV